MEYKEDQILETDQRLDANVHQSYLQDISFKPNPHTPQPQLNNQKIEEFNYEINNQDREIAMQQLIKVIIIIIVILAINYVLIICFMSTLKSSQLGQLRIGIAIVVSFSIILLLIIVMFISIIQAKIDKQSMSIHMHQREKQISTSINKNYNRKQIMSFQKKQNNKGKYIQKAETTETRQYFSFLKDLSLEEQLSFIPSTLQSSARITMMIILLNEIATVAYLTLSWNFLNENEIHPLWTLKIMMVLCALAIVILYLLWPFYQALYQFIIFQKMIIKDIIFKKALKQRNKNQLKITNVNKISIFKNIQDLFLFAQQKNKRIYSNHILSSVSTIKQIKFHQKIMKIVTFVDTIKQQTINPTNDDKDTISHLKKARLTHKSIQMEVNMAQIDHGDQNKKATNDYNLDTLRSIDIRIMEDKIKEEDEETIND